MLEVNRFRTNMQEGKKLVLLFNNILILVVSLCRLEDLVKPYQRICQNTFSTIRLLLVRIVKWWSKTGQIIAK
jgi:hypothetical protein